MLITIAVDENRLESQIAKRFGHAGYYLLYSTETNEYESIVNTDHDHTHSALYELVHKGSTVFIVGNIGPHAYDIISSGSNKVFLARRMTAQEAIDKYISGELKELNEPTVKKSINHSH